MRPDPDPYRFTYPMHPEDDESLSPEAAAAQRDKRGAELKAQRVKMLEDIARELSGEVVFPTCFDVVVRLRKALQDPNCGVDQIVTLVNLDPLVASKLLRAANSVAFNPGSSEVRDLKSAVTRLGLNLVRTTAMSVAMNQLLRSKNMGGFEGLTRQLWQHSMVTASAARVVARQSTRFSPDVAMLAGLVHDLGAFYLVYRAAEYAELRMRPDTVKYLVFEWHESIGHSLLGALGLPEEIVDAVSDHDFVRQMPDPPRSLADVVYAANVLAARMFESLDPGAEPDRFADVVISEEYAALEGEIRTLHAEVSSQFA
jgi:HD-like signal output (HDOD) protein